eukprot:4920637-Amphidinium_carterae.1
MYAQSSDEAQDDKQRHQLNQNSIRTERGERIFFGCWIIPTCSDPGLHPPLPESSGAQPTRSRSG